MKPLTAVDDRTHHHHRRGSTLGAVQWPLVLLLACVAPLSAESDGPYELSWSSMDAAGVVASTAGPYVLGGTLGQIDSSVMTASPLMLAGGFWSIAGSSLFVSADFDQDNDVDYEDMTHFVNCFTGPLLGPLANGCNNADLDVDGDVDLSDFARLQLCLSGSGIPPNPACDD